MRLPWVSRRYAELLERTVERLQAERDEQTSRADRAVDNLAMAIGAAPVSSAVRADVKMDSESTEKYLASLIVEDETAGMLDSEWLTLDSETHGKRAN